MNVVLVENADLMEVLNDWARVRGIESGAIVSLIGAADSFTISTMPEHDATDDVITTYDLPAEMHGTGEIVDGKVHVHATMAVAGDKAIAGHLHAAKIGTHFARAYITT